MEKKQVYIEAEITGVVRMQVPRGTPEEKIKEVAKELLCMAMPQTCNIQSEFDESDEFCEISIECSDLNMSASLEDPDF